MGSLQSGSIRLFWIRILLFDRSLQPSWTTYTFLTWTQVSNPQPGDVAVNENHCGIYIGGGQMIHAADYGIGVIVGPFRAV